MPSAALRYPHASDGPAPPRAPGTAAATDAPRTRAARAPWARLLLVTLAGSALLVQPAAAESAPARTEPGSTRAGTGHAPAAGPGTPASSKAPAGSPTASKPPAAEKRSLADELFTEAEREAWRQKIAAAPDEAQKRQLRGQRLAELQRRSREAKAAAGTGKPSTAPAREAR